MPVDDALNAMDYFLPSDIARLVLGFLKENGFLNTYNSFLKECPDLKEYLRLLKAGRELQTTILGYSLLLILQEWGKMKQAQTPVQSVAEKTKITTKSSNLFRSSTSLVSKSRKSPYKQQTLNFPISQNNSDSNESDSGCAVNMTGVPETPIVWSSGSPVQTNLTEKFNTPSSESTRTVDNMPITSASHLPATSQLNPSPAKCNKAPGIPSITLLSKTDHDHHDLNGGYPTLKGLLLSTKSAVTCSSLTQQTSNKSSTGQDNTGQTVEVTLLEKRVQETETVCANKSTSNPTTAQSTEVNSVVEVSTANAQIVTVAENIPHVTVTSSSSTNETTVQVSAQSSVVQLNRVETVDANNKCITWINSSLNQEQLKLSKTSPSKISPSATHSREGQVTPRKASVSATTVIPLTTPVKQLQTFEACTHKRSPRRKKPNTPRKRTSDVSPVSIHSTSEDPIPMFQMILNDTRLHEKLAETCNMVTVQLKMNHSREVKEEDKKSKHVDQEVEDVEAITASKSLEEILDMDTNFASDLVGDKIDMNDPAFDSLFKLFGTDKESFNEHIRREKQRTEEIQSEVEELEKSIQEMASSCGNSPHPVDFYGSPLPVTSIEQAMATETTTSQASQHVLQSSAHSARTANAAGSFTALLQEGAVISNPVHSTPSHHHRISTASSHTLPDQCLYSPCSTSTQPFSPCPSEYHHSYKSPTTISPTGTTPSQQLSVMSPCISTIHHFNSPSGAQEVPGTPRQLHSDIDGPSSPLSHLSSTPINSPNAVNNHPTVHFSTPTHRRHNACLPPNCSPLVKADIHIGSPIMVQKNGSLTPKAKRVLIAGSMQTSSRPLLSPNLTKQPLGEKHGLGQVAKSSSSDHHLQQGNTDSGVSSQVSDSCSQASGNLSFEHNPCSTIENSVGLISLPQPNAEKTEEKGQRRKGKGTEKSRVKEGGKEKKMHAKKEKEGSNKFTTLKGILSQPACSTNSHSTIDVNPPATPEKGGHGDILSENIVLMSPGGSTFTLPVLACHDDNQMEANESASLWDENLDTSTQLSILPENQITQSLVQSIAEGGFKSETVLSQIQALSKPEKKKSEKNTSGKPSRKCKTLNKESKKQQKEQKQMEGYFNGYAEDHSGQEPFSLDPNEIYTATPVTSASKTIASVSRSLNFAKESDTDSSNNQNLRKIVPKPSETGKQNAYIFVDRLGQVIGHQNVPPGVVIPQIVPTPVGLVTGPKIFINANGEIQILNQHISSGSGVSIASTDVSTGLVESASSGCSSTNLLSDSASVPEKATSDNIATAKNTSIPHNVNIKSGIKNVEVNNVSNIKNVEVKNVSNKTKDSQSKTETVTFVKGSDMESINDHTLCEETNNISDRESKGDRKKAKSVADSSEKIQAYDLSDDEVGQTQARIQIVDDDIKMVKSIDTSENVTDNSLSRIKVLPLSSTAKSVTKILRKPVRETRLARKHELLEQKMKSIAINAEISKPAPVNQEPGVNFKPEQSFSKEKNKPEADRAKVKCEIKQNNKSHSKERCKENDKDLNVLSPELSKKTCNSGNHSVNSKTKNDGQIKNKDEGKASSSMKEKNSDSSQTSKCVSKQNANSSEKERKKNPHPQKNEKLKVKITSKKLISPDRGKNSLKLPYKKFNQPAHQESEDDMPLSSLKEKIKAKNSPVKTSASPQCTDESKIGKVSSENEKKLKGDTGVSISTTYERPKPSRASRRTKQDKKEESNKSNKVFTTNETTAKQVQSTPKKPRLETEQEPCIVTKEQVLETVGLTPTKAVHSILEFKSPERNNPLDVLAEWQNSGHSSRARTPLSVSRSARKGNIHTPIKSPCTPKRRTPAKKLFETPEKNKSRKQVNGDVNANDDIVGSVGNGLETMNECDGEVLESPSKKDISSDLLKALESEVLLAVGSITTIGEDVNVEADLHLSDTSFVGYDTNLSPSHNELTTDQIDVNFAEQNNIQQQTNEHTDQAEQLNSVSIEENSHRSKKKDKKKKHKKDKKHRRKSRDKKRSKSSISSLTENTSTLYDNAVSQSDSFVNNDSFEENKQDNANTDRQSSELLTTGQAEVGKGLLTVMSPLKGDAGNEAVSLGIRVTPTGESRHKHHSSSKHKKGKKRHREEDSVDKELRREKKRRRKEEKRARQSLEKLSSLDIDQALKQLAEHSSPPKLANSQ